MRFYVLLGAIAVAGTAMAGTAWLAIERPAPAPTSERPALAQAAPQAAAPAPALVPAPAPPAAIAALPAPPPAPPPAPDLPNVDVASHPIHAVPDEDAPAAPVTIVDRSGRLLKQLKPAPALSPTYVPSVGPGGAASAASRGVATPGVVPPPSGPRPASLPPGTAFNGAASAAGGTILAVGGRSVRLYGVKLAEPRDRCGLGAGDSRSCADVARDVLAQRLLRYPNVTCRVPAAQRGAAAAICTDGSGVDLGGFLVAEGYALADTGQSYDYSGAEGVARAFHRGLWRYR